MEMDGTVKNVLDSLSREGVINLNSDFYKMDFLSSLTGGVVIPSGMNIHGKAGMKGNDLFTETTLSQNEGKVQLNAEYNLLKEAYKADIQINELTCMISCQLIRCFISLLVCNLKEQEQIFFPNELH